LWLVFPTAFAAAPVSYYVKDVDTVSKYAFVFNGSVSAGSMYIEAEDASANVAWIAIGK